eukprot:1472364-Rhodomonas_salina.3
MPPNIKMHDRVRTLYLQAFGTGAARLKQPGARHKTTTIDGVVERKEERAGFWTVKFDDGQTVSCSLDILTILPSTQQLPAGQKAQQRAAAKQRGGAWRFMALSRWTPSSPRSSDSDPDSDSQSSGSR